VTACGASSARETAAEQAAVEVAAEIFFDIPRRRVVSGVALGEPTLEIRAAAILPIPDHGP